MDANREAICTNGRRSLGWRCLPSATMAARGATCRHLQEVFPALLTVNGLSSLQTPASVGEKFPDSLLLAGLSLPLPFFPGAGGILSCVGSTCLITPGLGKAERGRQASQDSLGCYHPPGQKRKGELGRSLLERRSANQSCMCYPHRGSNDRGIHGATGYQQGSLGTVLTRMSWSHPAPGSCWQVSW